MTTATSSFVWSNANATATRVWIDGVKALILAAGLTVTTDTGQLDTTTITTTQGANVTIGYHVFKFPDTLQATTPIIVRVGYFTDAGSRPTISVIVGSSTDGAGTVALPTFTVANGTMGAFLTTAIPSYACYVDGTFTMVLGYLYIAAGGQANHSVAAVVIDRARTVTGTALADGFLVEGISNSGSTVSNSRSMYGAGSPAVSTGFIPSLMPSKTAIASADGADINVFRHYMMVPGVRPSLGSLTYFMGELAALDPLTVTVLGSSHTFLPVGYAANYWTAVPVNNTPSAAIRWE